MTSPSVCCPQLQKTKTKFGSATGHAANVRHRPTLERVFAAFPGANPDRLVDWRDEDLAVTDAAGSGHGEDGLDDVADDVVLDDNSMRTFGTKSTT